MNNRFPPKRPFFWQNWELEQWFVVLCVVGVVLVVVAAVQESHSENAFLADCQKSEKLYRCQMYWKQAHPDPITVFAPLNR